MLLVTARVLCGGGGNALDRVTQRLLHGCTTRQMRTPTQAAFVLAWLKTQATSAVRASATVCIFLHAATPP